jgi:hypothetical protein
MAWSSADPQRTRSRHAANRPNRVTRAGRVTGTSTAAAAPAHSIRKDPHVAHAGHGRVLVNWTLSVRHRSPGSCSGSIADRRGSCGWPCRAGQRRGRCEGCGTPVRSSSAHRARNRRVLLPRRSLRRAHRPGRPGRAASCPAGRAGSAMTGASVPHLRPPPGGARGRALSRPRWRLDQGIDERVFPERVRSRVTDDPAVLRQEVRLVPLTRSRQWQDGGPLWTSCRRPARTRCPWFQAFRAEHPDIEIAGPAGLRTGLWPADRGRQDPRRQIPACASCPAALMSCARPVRRAQPERPRVPK